MKEEKILVVDDTQATREIISRNLMDNDYKVICSSNVKDAIDHLKKEPVMLVITDLKMPDYDGLDLIKHVKEFYPQIEIIMVTGYPTIETAVEAVKLGADDYLTKPFTDVELLAAVSDAMKKIKLKKELLNSAPDDFGKKFGIIGKSARMLEIFKTIKKVAVIDSTVLITGESGTGKELIARAIHYSGSRSNAPFVPINCGAIPENLLESELFGHVKGAFTSANSTRTGFFQNANHGTIFLDEISETSMQMQIKLLRVLQEKEIYMVGSKKAQKVDVRILAATNKDLFSLVKANKFREDLFYRLNVINIAIPPLRKRRDDIPLLVNQFAKKISYDLNKPVPNFSEKCLNALKNNYWQGNVRELENIINRLIVLTDSPEIKYSDLPDYFKASGIGDDFAVKTLAAMETDYIKKIINYTNNNKTKAAEILGIDRKTLRKKLDPEN